MAKRKGPYWKYGQRAQLAREMEMNEANLAQILKRERGVSVERAHLLSHLCLKLFRKKIPWTEWVNNKYTTHEAFRGDRLEKNN